MNHRFSNTRRIRDHISQSVNVFRTWEDVPQELRVLILESIQVNIEEVLNEL